MGTECLGMRRRCRRSLGNGRRRRRIRRRRDEPVELGAFFEGTFKEGIWWRDEVLSFQGF